MSDKSIKALRRVYNHPDFMRNYITFDELKRAFYEVDDGGRKLTTKERIMQAMIDARVPVVKKAAIYINDTLR